MQMLRTVSIISPADEFPEPKDPRLRSLLKVAGSPSIQKAYGSIPSIDSLFGTVIRSIGHYMAVDSFELCGSIPSFNLDGDRYAVLKLIYTLVSSSEFGGDASVRKSRSADHLDHIPSGAHFDVFSSSLPS